MNKLLKLGRRPFLAAAIAALMLLGVYSAAVTAEPGSDDVVMVLNARNPTTELSRSEVKSLYMGSTSFWNGVVPVQLVVRTPEAAASEAFFEQVLGLSAQRFDGHWASRQLSGQGVAPVKLATSDEVVNRVRSSPGAIGFVLASEMWEVKPDGVRVVEVK